MTMIGEMPTRYVELEDESDPDSIYMFDIDFVLSSWGCTFGTTCPGHRDTHPGVLGCCTFGVVLSKGDIKRIKKIMPRLAASGMWENADVAYEDGFYYKEVDVDGADYFNTVVHRGACIFANRGERPGCSLHILAMDEGGDPYEYKPRTCSHMPVTRSIYPHRTGKNLIVVHAWDWHTWDANQEGHAYIDWACPQDEANYAHDRTPVFYRYRKALVAMSTERVVDRLQEHLEKFAGMKNDTGWYPVALKGRADGRLHDQLGDGGLNDPPIEVAGEEDRLDIGGELPTLDELIQSKQEQS